MQKSLIAILILFFFGCDTPTESMDSTEEIAAIDEGAKSPSEFEIKKNTPIQLPIGSLELEDDPFFKSNHYGTFFDDQLSCYVIDIEDDEIAGAKVSKVVLFYLDHVLYKKKYILESSPIDQIKPEIRKFKVKSLTKNRKSICKNKNNKECAELVIAQNQFQFSWKKDRLDYELYNWETESDTEIILTEKRSDYKEALRFAKFQLNIK